MVQLIYETYSKSKRNWFKLTRKGGIWTNFNWVKAVMFYILVFEWMSKPLKSIFCIPVTYPIMEVTFIIQAMNQWASSGSFRARDDSPFVKKKKKLIETRSLFKVEYRIFPFLLLWSVSLEYSWQMIRKWTWFDLMGDAKQWYSTECVRGCLEPCFSAALKLYPCEDDLFPRNTAQPRWSDSLSCHSKRLRGVRLWHSWQGW